MLVLPFAVTLRTGVSADAGALPMNTPIVAMTRLMITLWRRMVPCPFDSCA
jgi:hypothetical protein